MLREDFDPQPTLQNDTLALRALKPEGLDALHAAAADLETWAGHPAQDRHKLETFAPYFRFLLDRGGTLVVIDRAAHRIIGCSRYYAAPDRPVSISIGFTFLNHAYWGGVTNRALKRLMLDHAFRMVPEVWFHIAPTNIRSQKATVKLGAQYAYDTTLDLSGVRRCGCAFG